jgi:hypothetical protein
MIDNEIIQVLSCALSKYVGKEGFHFYPGNGEIKYVIRSDKFIINISYEVVDSLYTIKIETLHNNSFQNVVFITKSKKYHQEVKKCFKRLGLSPKKFCDHIYAFSEIISKHLEVNGDPSFLEDVYPSDLRFDGIFI